MGDFRCEEYDLWECSPIRPAENWKTDASAVIAALFRSGENANIVSHFAITDGKARPHGYGITQNRETWLAEIAHNGPPQSAAGVWIRPNPTDGNGISDANVTAYRFLLVEFDAIPLPLQIAFIARLSLPVAAIITSGGKSVHAWIAVNAANATEYRALARRIFAALASFGVDIANRNPARLSRLPGVFREISTISGTDIRNLCAHHARLWDKEWGITPELPAGSAWTPPFLPHNNRLFASLLVQAAFLRHIRAEKAFIQDWKQRVKSLIETRLPACPASFAKMGLPADWQKHPVWLQIA